MRRLLVPLVLLAVLASACSVKLGDQADSATTRGAETLSSPIPPSKEPVAAVVNRVLPATVNVTTDIFSADEFGNPQEGQGVGTGFIVRSDGVIVTNCHVVEGASKITVFSSDDDPTEYDARLIGADCLHDLAVLKIDETGLPTVALGNSGDLALGSACRGDRLRPRARRRPHRHHRHRVLARSHHPGAGPGMRDVSDEGRAARARPHLQRRDPDRRRHQPRQLRRPARRHAGPRGRHQLRRRRRTPRTSGSPSRSTRRRTRSPRRSSRPLAPTAYLGVSTQPVTADLAVQQDLSRRPGRLRQRHHQRRAGRRRRDRRGRCDRRRRRTRRSGPPEDLGSILDSIRPDTTVPVEIVGPVGRAAHDPGHAGRAPASRRHPVRRPRDGVR